jgi:hydroxymethylpyrimidine pyrophosphatase-like HAD family hydrolase
MGRSQETIEMPSGVDVQKAKKAIESILRENDQFEVESIDESSNESTINAKAKPNLFSWGEEVWIQVRPSEIEVVSENTTQIIDWNRPQNNVENIIEELQNHFNQQEHKA